MQDEIGGVNMERLTLPHYGKKGHYMKCSERLGCDGNCGECDELDKLVNRLAYYEDLEEQGRLVMLPCKVGDTVYFAAWFGTEPHVVERIIEPFFYTTDARKMGSSADFYLRDFGCSVFHTREEAEAALRGESDGCG